MAAPYEPHAPAWSIRLAFELSANDQTSQALAAGLTREQLNWHPAPGSWSIGQCLEHLCIANETYLAAIAAALPDHPDSPVDQITPGWISRWFIRKFIEPSPNGRKGFAPPKIKPAGADVELSVFDRFLSSNKACREFIVHGRSKNVNAIRFWNPLVPGIRFTVGTGLEIISSHERRHLLQAERVRDSANFPH